MLKLGILGLSAGNGHPYSWSAIFNGYDPQKMAGCPFAVIPEYLAKVDRGAMGIEGATITHIWTQDRDVSEHVAGAALIPHVVEEMTDLIGQVDAIVLARDDGEHHLEMAKPFVEAGLPIFIDKPLTDNADDLRQFVTWYEAGKPIMSCSSTRYYSPLRAALPDLGRVHTAHAISGKYWRTYGMHIIEGVYAVMGPGVESVRNIGRDGAEVVHLQYADGRQAVLQTGKEISFALHFSFYGDKDSLLVTEGNTYNSFRDMLCDFVGMLKSGQAPIDWRNTVEMAKVLVAGEWSLRQGGREVCLSEIA